jgi:hypothetical protein
LPLKEDESLAIDVNGSLFLDALDVLRVSSVLRYVHEQNFAGLSAADTGA